MYKTRLYYTTEPQNKDCNFPKSSKTELEWENKALGGWHSGRPRPPVTLTYIHEHTNKEKTHWSFKEQALRQVGSSQVLRQVPGSSVGKKGLKIKASCVWQFRATYLFDFRGSTAFLGLFHRAVFSILCPFDVQFFFFSNSHGGKKILFICQIFWRVSLKVENWINPLVLKIFALQL